MNISYLSKAFNLPWKITSIHFTDLKLLSVQTIYYKDYILAITYILKMNQSQFWLIISFFFFCLSFFSMDFVVENSQFFYDVLVQKSCNCNASKASHAQLHPQMGQMYKDRRKKGKENIESCFLDQTLACGPYCTREFVLGWERVYKSTASLLHLHSCSSLSLTLSYLSREKSTRLWKHQSLWRVGILLLSLWPNMMAEEMWCWCCSLNPFPCHQPNYVDFLSSAGPTRSWWKESYISWSTPEWTIPPHAELSLHTCELAVCWLLVWLSYPFDLRLGHIRAYLEHSLWFESWPISINGSSVNYVCWLGKVM